jgi:hypothetical protein
MDLIKTQDKLEQWLKGQCDISGVDTLRVRVAAEVYPRFDIHPRDDDFPEENLANAARKAYLEGSWWYERLKVSVFVEGVSLAQQEAILPAGHVPTLCEGEIVYLDILSIEDRQFEWQLLAATAVSAATVRLGLLRSAEISWIAPVDHDDDHSPSSPQTEMSESSPTPS